MAKTVGELLVFRKACRAADALLALCRGNIAVKDRDLYAQLNRASIRVVSDIAEGFEQKTDRHLAKYLYDARGGVAEIRVQLRLAAMRGYVDEQARADATAIYDEVGRMLSGLIAYLEASNRTRRS